MGLVARAARFFAFARPSEDDDSADDDSTLAGGSKASTLVDCDAICHIQRLPDPVLGAIFQHSKRAAHPQQQRVESVVAQVAPKWRKVALEEPGLWTDIDAVRVRLDQQLALLRWYLDKSDGHPVDIRLDLSQEGWDVGVGRLLLDEVVTQTERLRRLSIRADFAGADNVVRRALHSRNAPHLQHLSLIFLEQHEYDPDVVFDIRDFHRPEIFTLGAPLLATLRLQHTEIPMLPPLHAITQLHLEEYSCSPMSHARLAALLHALPLLAHLSIYGAIITAGGTTTSTSPIHLPRLRSLRSSANPHVSALLLALDAPALSSLVLKNLRPTELDRLFASLRRPLVALRTLALHGTLPPPTLADLLIVCPRITRLELINCYADDALRLLRTSPSASLAPGLRELTVHRVRDAQLLLLGTRGLERVSVHCGYAAPEKMVFPGVEVRTWERLAPWPPGAEYEDADDMFMRLKVVWDDEELPAKRRRSNTLLSFLTPF